VYLETITAGGCDTGGTWAVKVVNSTQLEVHWSLAGKSYDVTAVVSR